MLSILPNEPFADLELDETLGAWRRYVQSGSIDERIVRPHVARAWQRSREGGCDPDMMRADTLSAQDTVALLESQQLLIQSARPFAVALSRAAGPNRHAAMLADADVRVLDVVGDEQSVRGPEAVPGPGSLLAEPNAGANGLGTPIAEGRYVELVGPEHYISGFHIFTCQGVPLRGASGDTVGVLGISVRRLETAQRVRDVLFCAAQGIECDLLSQSLSEAVARATTLAGNADLSENLRQDLVQGLAAARLRLEIAAQRIARGSSATELLRGVEELVQRFRRLATAWRDLVIEGPSAPAPVSLAKLTGDIVDLLATEARIMNVSIRLDGDEVVVEEDRPALARALLNKLLTAMQKAGPGGEAHIKIGTSPDGSHGVVEIRPQGAQGKAEPERVQAPKLS